MTIFGRGPAQLLVLALAITVFGQTAVAGSVCQELFRPTPELESVLRRPFVDVFGRDATSIVAHGPSRTRILRAIEADVLGLKTIPALSIDASARSRRALYQMKRWFDLLHMKKSRTDDALIEFHRRQFEKVLDRQGPSAHNDFQARLRDAKPYLSTMFSVAANGAVNYLSYTYLGAAGVVVHVPALRLFDARNIPDAVITELINAKPSDPTPRTRAFINTKVKHGADIVFQTVRRIFNFSIIALAATFYADLLIDPAAWMQKNVDATTTTLYAVAGEQNQRTLRLVLEKRANYVARGDLESVAAADALIAEIMATQTARDNRASRQSEVND